jgi:hypothetical protein
VDLPVQGHPSAPSRRIASRQSRARPSTTPTSSVSCTASFLLPMSPLSLLTNQSPLQQPAQCDAPSSLYSGRRLIRGHVGIHGSPTDWAMVRRQRMPAFHSGSSQQTEWQCGFGQRRGFSWRLGTHRCPQRRHTSCGSVKSTLTIVANWSSCTGERSCLFGFMPVL